MFTVKKINLLNLISESSEYVSDTYPVERIKKVNKIIKNKIFSFEGEIFEDIQVQVDYQFQITGVKKMISVGEFYDYLTVDIEVVGGDKRFDVWMKISPTFLNNYKMLGNLHNSMSDELQYFFGSDYVRINIPKGSLKLSDEYKKEINNIDLKNTEI